MWLNKKQNIGLNIYNPSIFYEEGTDLTTLLGWGKYPTGSCFLTGLYSKTPVNIGLSGQYDTTFTNTKSVFTYYYVMISVLA